MPFYFVCLFVPIDYCFLFSLSLDSFSARIGLVWLGWLGEVGSVLYYPLLYYRRLASVFVSLLFLIVLVSLSKGLVLVDYLGWVEKGMTEESRFRWIHGF